MPSLRGRVIIGAILWTVGLFIVSMALMAVIVRYFPDTPVLGRAGQIHVWVFHTWLLLPIALVCMVAGAFQVRRGLAGVTQLRARLGAVHDGRDEQIHGEYVTEVQPLVDDLNALLDHRAQAVKRAVAKAGDLAHGLKTPLALLAREAERAQADGQPELATAIAQQVDRMRRQIDYHLAHARAAASGATPGTRSAIKDSADALARTLLRLHADRTIAIDVQVPPSHTARVQREDLDELLGNLLDNACKWTAARIVVDSVARGSDIVITVDDDGPGLPAALRYAVLERGVRVDERTAGSGLGLAIVRDLADVYRGSIRLDDSPLGGLRDAAASVVTTKHTKGMRVMHRLLPDEPEVGALLALMLLPTHAAGPARDTWRTNPARQAGPRSMGPACDCGGSSARFSDAVEGRWSGHTSCRPRSRRYTTRPSVRATPIGRRSSHCMDCSSGCPTTRW